MVFESENQVKEKENLRPLAEEPPPSEEPEEDLGTHWVE